ncbi:MAG TPA: VOC family protein [Acidobacteriaceae bacterium]
MRPNEASAALGLGHSVMVRVEDADAHAKHAKDHGARITQDPTSYPYGERQYNAEDFAGYSWTFSQSIADVHPREWGGTAEQL